MLELIALIASAVFTFNGYITIGDFVAYVLYVKMFIQPIRKLINFSDQFQNGMSGFQRFEELLKVETEKESKDAKELKNVNGEIIIDNVTFRYESNNEEVFNGFNLKIDAGKTVALVGPSGEGRQLYVV